jgi:hypothetical protein
VQVSTALPRTPLRRPCRCRCCCAHLERVLSSTEVIIDRSWCAHQWGESPIPFSRKGFGRDGRGGGREERCACVRACVRVRARRRRAAAVCVCQCVPTAKEEFAIYGDRIWGARSECACVFACEKVVAASRGCEHTACVQQSLCLVDVVASGILYTDRILYASRSNRQHSNLNIESNIYLRASVLSLSGWSLVSHRHPIRSISLESRVFPVYVVCVSQSTKRLSFDRFRPAGGPGGAYIKGPSLEVLPSNGRENRKDFVAAHSNDSLSSNFNSQGSRVVAASNKQSTKYPDLVHFFPDYKASSDLRENT